MPSYEQSIQGLTSANPKILLDSALWFICHPDQISDQNYYLHACEILSKASSCDPEVLQYVDQNLQHDPMFRVQLFSQVIKETTEPEVKQTALMLLDKIIEHFQEIKSDSTEIIAQIYSSLVELGDPNLIEKAKKMM